MTPASGHKQQWAIDQFQKAIKIKNISAHAIPKLNIEHTYQHNIQQSYFRTAAIVTTTPTCIIYYYSYSPGGLISGVSLRGLLEGIAPTCPCHTPSAV